MTKEWPDKEEIDRFSGNGLGIVNVSAPTPEQQAAVREWNEALESGKIYTPENASTELPPPFYWPEEARADGEEGFGDVPDCGT